MKPVNFPKTTLPGFRKSDTLLETIWQESPVGLQLYDATGRLIDINRACLEIFGVTNRDAVARFKLFDELNVTSEAKAKLAQGEPVNYKIGIDFNLVNQLHQYQTTKTGQCYLNVHIAPLVYEGSLMGYLAQIQDITESKFLEESLRRSHQELERIFNAIPDLYIRISPAGIILNYLGGREKDIFPPIDQFQGKPVEAVLPPEIGKQVKQAIDKVIASKQLSTIQQNLHIAGENQVFEARLLPVEDDLVAIVRNITKHKITEAALQESEQRYRTLVEISPSPITLIDLSGRFLTTNPAGLKLCGYKNLDEMLASGRNFFEVMIEEDREKARAAIAEATLVGEVHNVELRICRVDGSIVPVEFSASVLRDGTGNPSAFICASRDISDRKQAEQTQARMLKETSTLLNDLQHRIKNSLALISSLVSLEEDRATEEETRQVLAALHRQVISLVDLYTLLYETKNSQVIYLDQYLARLVQSLSSSYIREWQDINVKIDLEETLIDARQATAFGLILNELFTNAIKHAFLAEGRGQVSISLKKVGDQLALEISNDGERLPADFDLEHSEGFGLQIVQMLTLQLNGKITWSQNSKTTFILTVALSQVSP